MAGGNEAYTPLAAVPASPPRVGLLASVAGNPAGLPARWANGFVIDPEDCAAAAVSPGWWCHDTGSGGGVADGPNPEDRVPYVYYRPWMARVTDECSVVSADVGDYQARVRRLFTAAESRIIETELWDGAVAQAAGFPNRHLNAATADDLGTHGLAYALAELQEYLANTLDSRGMIHATPRTVSLWLAATLIRREGNLLLDAFDNIVVPGQGYDGSGPGDVAPPASGDRHWAYATSMVTVIREPAIEVDPPSMSEATTRSSNLVQFTAQRIVAAYWEGCSHAGVEVNLCDPSCTASGS